MSESRPPASSGDKAKAERLAAALRENLKKRKAQARALAQPAGETAPAAASTIPPQSDKDSA